MSDGISQDFHFAFPAASEHTPNRLRWDHFIIFSIPNDSSGTVLSEYIYFNGRRIARRDVSTGNVYYFITDHIGNARVVTNATGGVVEESDFLPFGTENVITSTLDNNYKFIGMERDFEGTAALDHTLYRQYAPNLARWVSPDPVHGSPENPQSWNRYPYVLNDPMTLVDPLGTSIWQDPYLVGFFRSRSWLGRRYPGPSASSSRGAPSSLADGSLPARLWARRNPWNGRVLPGLEQALANAFRISSV
ncbi:MAG: hypothetical protein HY316_01415 [Acidobacteria bacterium]|nr:hypothetical protein [Acidobacteriota bacterium]